MRLAWLCYDIYEDEELVTIVFEEPDEWRFSKVIPIVYAEIKSGE